MESRILSLMVFGGFDQGNSRVEESWFSLFLIRDGLQGVWTNHNTLLSGLCSADCTSNGCVCSIPTQYPRGLTLTPDADVCDLVVNSTFCQGISSEMATGL